MNEPTPSAKTSDAAALRGQRLRPLLASPCCRTPVAEAGGSLRCEACGRDYPRLRGVPILLERADTEWLQTTERKLRFASRPRWRRRLLNPDLTSKTLQLRRLREFLAAVPSGGVAMDVGASLRRLSDDLLCFDLMPTPGVDLVGDLHRIPLAEGSLDAVVCTGVLEHVEDPGCVVEELRRVLKPGGRIYVSLPFLQGYHPSPLDFHRFTIDGARRLMAPFEIEAVVNTRGSGSTVTWILSAFLAELVSFDRPRLYALSKPLFGWLLLPLKYLDLWLTRSRFDYLITSGFTVLARKPADVSQSNP